MKGQKTGGRQKGTPNKITAEKREFLSNLFSENYELIQQDFLNLDSYQRCMVITKILPYILPKMQPVCETEEQKRAAEQLRLYSNIADIVFFWEQQKHDEQQRMQVQNQAEQQPEQLSKQQEQNQPEQQEQHEQEHQQQETQQNEAPLKTSTLDPKPAPVIRNLRNQPPHRPFYASVPQKRRKH